MGFEGSSVVSRMSSERVRAATPTGVSFARRGHAKGSGRISMSTDRRVDGGRLEPPDVLCRTASPEAHEPGARRARVVQEVGKRGRELDRRTSPHWGHGDECTNLGRQSCVCRGDNAGCSRHGCITRGMAMRFRLRCETDGREGGISSPMADMPPVDQRRRTSRPSKPVAAPSSRRLTVRLGQHVCAARLAGRRRPSPPCSAVPGANRRRTGPAPTRHPPRTRRRPRTG